MQAASAVCSDFNYYCSEFLALTSILLGIFIVIYGIFLKIRKKRKLNFGYNRTLCVILTVVGLAVGYGHRLLSENIPNGTITALWIISGLVTYHLLSKANLNIILAIWSWFAVASQTDSD